MKKCNTATHCANVSCWCTWLPNTSRPYAGPSPESL